MAFTMQESGEWGVTDDSISPEPHRETPDARNQTPIETLDSSESNFSCRVVEPSREGIQENDGFETLTREDAAKLYVWSEGTTSPSSSLGRDKGEEGRSEGVLANGETERLGERGKEVVEDVDTPEGGAQENAATSVTPHREAVEPTADPVPPEEEGQTEDLLNKTLTPTKDDNLLLTERTESQPLIEVDRSETPDKSFVRRRGATYRKSRSSLSPVPVDMEGGQQLEGVGTEDEPSMAGDYTRRSGTFRKEKPSLPSTTILIDSPEANMDTNTIETGLAETGRPAAEDTRSRSALQLESPINYYMEGDSLEPELTNNEGSGVKRSNTFRKEKPMLQVSPIVRRDSDSDQQSDQNQNRDSDHELEDEIRQTSTEPPTQTPTAIPTVSLTLPPNSAPVVAYPESDDDSVEDSYLLVDDDHPASHGGGGVRRRGTFTKERPNTLFGDDYF